MLGDPAIDLLRVSVGVSRMSLESSDDLAGSERATRHILIEYPEPTASSPAKADSTKLRASARS
jgi:hypothetical protein